MIRQLSVFASVGWKDSVANIVKTGELVWNLTTRNLAVQMNQTSAALLHGTDELKFAGLTPIAGNIVKADLIAQSPVSFECKLSQCIQLTAANGDKIDSWLVLGEVVAVHIDKHLLSAEGIYQTALADPVFRAGGPSAYYGIAEELRFDLHRPTV